MPIPLNSSIDCNLFFDKNNCDMTLFEGENALKISTVGRVNNVNQSYNANQLVNIFAFSLYNSLKGVVQEDGQVIKWHAKKDKDKILNYILKAQQEYPEAIEAFAILACNLSYDYIYVIDKLIEIKALKLNQYFPLELTLKYLPQTLGFTPLMFIYDVKIINHLMTSYSVDYSVVHGGKAFFLKSKERILEYYNQEHFLYKKIWHKCLQLDNLTILGQSIKQKQKKKMNSIQKLSSFLNKEENHLLSQILNAKSIYQKFLLFSKAIYSNNQEILKHLNNPIIQDVLKHQQGVGKITLLSKAVEYENLDFIKALINTGIYDKKELYSIANNTHLDSLLLFALENKLNKSAIFLLENKFYSQTYCIEQLIDVSKRNKEMIEYFYQHFTDKVSLDVLLMSKNNVLLLQHLEKNHISTKEVYLFYIKYQNYILYDKEQHKRIIYHNIYSKTLIEVIHFICQKENNFNCYEQFENHIKCNFVKNRRGFLHSQGYRNIDEHQLLILYSIVKSIIPSKARSFLSLANSLLPDNERLFKAEKKQLEEFLFKTCQDVEDLKRIKI
jgi:hypothetical protein